MGRATKPVMAQWHGTRGGYRKHGCRCGPCTEATRQAKAIEQENRLRRRVPAAIHGRRSTYTNWGCRCEPCTEANTTHAREYRSRALYG